jgi:integrase
MLWRMTVVVLGTAVRRGELLGLRWADVDLLERRLQVRQEWVRGEFTSPKSRASRRTIGFGLKTAAALEAQWQASRYRRDSDVVFGHPALGSPLDPTKLTPRLREGGASAGEDREGGFAAVARATAHGADERRGGREPETPTFRRRPATRSSRSRSGTSTPRRPRSPVLIERSEERMFGTNSGT